MMKNGDPEERIFLSYPHTNNGFCFLLTTVPEVPEYAKIQFHMVTLVNVNPPVVATTSCWWQFSALVVA